jgi:hypothetical protein
LTGNMEQVRAATETVAADPPPFHEDGIYFGLDAEKTYHRDLALGSGDIKRLFYNPAEYWWKSGMNPLRPGDTDTPYKSFGRAVHVFVLEGPAKFDRLYERENTDPDVLHTYDDIKAWLAERKLRAPRLKSEAVATALALDPTVKIADAIKERAEVAGRKILKADEYARIKISAKMIAESPDLDEAFAGGMPEVAVFYTEVINGVRVRCKSLFDYLKIRGIGDLKSTSNPYEEDFAGLCSKRFSNGRMDLQVSHYMRARQFIARYVAEGRVHGDHDPAWLKRVAETPEYAFAHVFFQADGAPSVLARTTSPGNPILENAESDRSVALHHFADFYSRFGTGMWLRRDRMSEWDINDLPPWHGRRAG